LRFSGLLIPNDIIWIELLLLFPFFPIYIPNDIILTELRLLFPFFPFTIKP